MTKILAIILSLFLIASSYAQDTGHMVFLPHVHAWISGPSGFPVYGPLGSYLEPESLALTPNSNRGWDIGVPYIRVFDNPIFETEQDAQLAIDRFEELTSFLPFMTNDPTWLPILPQQTQPLNTNIPLALPDENRYSVWLNNNRYARSAVYIIYDEPALNVIPFGNTATFASYAEANELMERYLEVFGISSHPDIYVTKDWSGNRHINHDPLPALDFSQNGIIDVTDIFVYLNCWFCNDHQADLDYSGNCDITDLFTYISDWFKY